MVKPGVSSSSCGCPHTAKILSSPTRYLHLIYHPGGGGGGGTIPPTCLLYIQPVRATHGRRNHKDTNPSMSSSLVILFGVVKQFCRFWVWSETECKTPAEDGLQYNSITPNPPPPPPQTHTVCIYCTLHSGRQGGDKSVLQHSNTSSSSS